MYPTLFVMVVLFVFLYRQCLCLIQFLVWQCLLHLASFQHQIAAALAAPVVSLCSSIYYLSSWRHCPNPNFNCKVLEKKKSYSMLLLSSAIFGKCVQRKSIPQFSEWQASSLTTKIPGLCIRCVKVPYLSQINEKKAV